MMAGEIEDCIRLQAERLPTGSISFGRFELESLSWERRSSFNHNRYLEEVEKYSRPGSVTQTRAILEAHFKKKPLLPQTSLENKSEAQCQPTENGLHHHASCPVEFKNHDDWRQPELARHDDIPSGSDEHELMECEEPKVTRPAESLIESMPCNNERVADPTNELADHDEIQHHREHDSLSSNKVDVCIVSEQEPDNKAVIMEELLAQKEAVIVEELKSCVSSENPAVERKRVPALKNTQKATLKAKGVEQKTEKPIRKDQLPAQNNLRKSSSERSHFSSGKMLSRSMDKQERESTLRTKLANQTLRRTPFHRSSEVQLSAQNNLKKSSTERNHVSSGRMLSRSMDKQERESTMRTKLVNQTLPRTPMPRSSDSKSLKLEERESTLRTKLVKQTLLRTPVPRSSDSKSLKSEASVSMKGKVRQGNGRHERNNENDARAMQSGIAPHSEMYACQPENRSKRVADSLREERKPTGVVFNFKSDERAEKRKEYFMKLEEKLHAKEVMMNEIQAKAQEQTETAIKQLRRSLNFKATPMPSFYHEVVPKVAEGRKVARPSKPQRLQPEKCTSLGNRASPTAKSQSLVKAPSNRGDERTKNKGSKLGIHSSGKKGEIVGGRERSVAVGVAS